MNDGVHESTEKTHEPENVESDLRKELKMLVHYTTGKICEEMAEEYNVTYTKEFIAALANISFEEIQASAREIKLFSQHAKRTTITPDDVKLLVRKSPNLIEYMEAFCTDLLNRRKDKKKDNASVFADVVDNSSNSNFENLPNIQPME